MRMRSLQSRDGTDRGVDLVPVPTDPVQNRTTESEEAGASVIDHQPRESWTFLTLTDSAAACVT